MFEKLYIFFFDNILKSSWKTVLTLWKPMAGWTFFVYIVFTALSAPLLVAMLDWTIFRGDRLFVGNEDLIMWLLSPAGFIYLFLFILIALTGIVIRFAGLFQIITDHLAGEQVSVLNTALHIAPRIPILVKVCVITIAGFFILLLPLLLGLGVIYITHLSQFDLNYYWYVTPPEWYRALTLGGIWTGIWLITALITTFCLMPALPAYLEGQKTLMQAIREIWITPISQTLRFLKVVTITATGWFFIRIFFDAALIAALLFLVEWVQNQFETIRPLAFLAGFYIFSSFTAGIVISFFGFSLISSVITKFYFSASKPELVPSTPKFMPLTRRTLKLITWWVHPVKASLLILMILAGSLATSFLIASGSGGHSEILVISHRANAGGAPENSIPALENSILLGIDMAEIDVQLTADGTVVVLHDEDLMRVAGDPRKISEIDISELSELKLISTREYPEHKLRIPVLTDFFELSRGKIVLMIELKYYEFNPELAEKTVDLIRSFKMEEQVVLKSMNFNAVQQLRELAPDLKTGYVSAAAAGNISRLPVHFLSVNHTGINPRLIADAHESGKDIYTWTVNIRDDMIQAILKGADGIITDRPELAIALFEEISGLTATERLLLQVGLFFLETHIVITDE